MPAQEREPRERETLIYKTPEEAAEFVERVENRVEQQPASDVQAPREIVADEVAQEIAQHGHGVSDRSEPWQHTADEHEKAQVLVNLAFHKDLKAALRRAADDPDHPRMLDLFHDVLTNELYELVVEHRMNRQSLVPWAVGTLVSLLLIILIVFGLLLLLAQ